jgi:transcription antitermination factor NusG
MNSNDKDKRWLVAYTKPKHEKLVKDELLKNNFETYLPLLKERRKWSDRKKWIEFPLFRSYIFIKTDPKNSLYLLKINGIVKIIQFGRKVASVRDKDLETIKKMITGGYKPRNENYFLKGNPVLVEDGPLKGLVGEVLEIENQNRLVIRIDAIQQSVSIKIEQGFLKLID